MRESGRHVETCVARSESPKSLATDAYHERVKHKAAAYWPARVMLVSGMVGTLFVAAVALALAVPLVPGLGEPLFGVLPTVLGVPVRIVGCVAGVVAALAGLTWMILIFHGPRDEPPDWRYRER